MHKWVLLAALLITTLPGYGQVEPYLMGRASMNLEQYESAVIHLREALHQDPGDVEILYHLGISYFETADYPAARNAFHETEKRRKGMGSFYLAKTDVRLNHPEQALKYLRIHLSSRYKVAEKDILLDEDLSKLESEPGWQALWNERRWYNSRDIEFQEAMFLKENGNTLEAINLLNKLEKQGYQRSRVQAEKAAIYAGLGNMKAARSGIRSSVKSDVRNLDALQLLAVYQVEDASSEEAVIGLSRVIRQDPARFDAYIQRAEARSLAGNLAGALEDMDLYLTYFPADDDAMYRKGKIEYSHGKYLNAIQSFNSALDLNKSKASYYFSRGLTYAATGTTRYAEKDMSMALDLDPYNGEIWFEKGALSEKLGNRTGACHCYQKALQYGIYEAGDFLDQNCRKPDGTGRNL